MTEQAYGVAVNYPYIGVAVGTETISFALVTERLVVFTTNSFIKVLKGLMAAYYIFNIEYPKVIQYPLCFIQHFLFNIKNDTLPQTIIRFISCIDKL